MRIDPVAGTEFFRSQLADVGWDKVHVDACDNTLEQSEDKERRDISNLEAGGECEI